MIKEAHILNAGFFKLDGGAMFGVVPKSIWSRTNPPDEFNRCTWAMNTVLLKTDDRLVLIDTGIGDKQDETFFKHFDPHQLNLFKEGLNEIGYGLNDITDVFLTHLHFDHCGGVISINENGDFVSTFPKAKVWTNRKHWEHALSPNPREKASFLKENLEPIQSLGLLNFVEDYPKELPFEIIEVNGHTEAQMLPLFEIDNQKFLFAADLIPSSSHMKLPYVMSYDIRPLDTMKEKEQILSYCYDNQVHLLFQHDPKEEGAILEKTSRGIMIKETFKLQDQIGSLS